MPSVFISYARSTEVKARRIAFALRDHGFDVWSDENLPAHRLYADVIQEELQNAKAVLVLWSADAVASQWVRSEADFARMSGSLVQARLEAASLPMPFDQVQCANLAEWEGEAEAAGWRQVIDSISALCSSSSRVSTLIVTPRAPVQPRGRSSDRPSLAVLPFTDLAPEAKIDFLADGMVEEIVTALARFRSFRVVTSGASQALRDDARSLRQIGQTLGARYLLEGVVRRAGQRVRVTAKLTDASESLSVWTERFEGEIDDVFELQDTIASAVAGQIEASIEVSETRIAQGRADSELSARDLYLLALPKIYSWQPDQARAALRLLERAIADEPEYARALAAAAFCHSQIYDFGGDGDLAPHVRAVEDYSRRALKADSNDPEVLNWVSVAPIHFTGNPGAVDALVDRALEANPNLPTLCNRSSFLKAFIGQPRLGLERVERAMRLDTRDASLPYNLMSKGICLFALEQFEDAVRLFTETHERIPDHPGTYFWLTAALAHCDRLDEAGKWLRSAPKDWHNPYLDMAHNPSLSRLLRSGLMKAGAKLPEPTAA